MGSPVHFEVAKLLKTADFFKISGPIIEIGSKQHNADDMQMGQTFQFRPHFSGQEYVGLDLEAGPGVDVVADLCGDVSMLGGKTFGLCICLSVLEHVRQPWIAAETITKLVRAGGWLFLSVPWIWRYHPYPDDYFRFSMNGLRVLFPAFDFAEHFYALTNGTVFDGNKVGPTVDNQLKYIGDLDGGRQIKYLPAMEIIALGRKV